MRWILLWSVNDFTNFTDFTQVTHNTHNTGFWLFVCIYFLFRTALIGRSFRLDVYRTTLDDSDLQRYAKTNANFSPFFSLPAVFHAYMCYIVSIIFATSVLFVVYVCMCVGNSSNYTLNSMVSPLAAPNNNTISRMSMSLLLCALTSAHTMEQTQVPLICGAIYCTFVLRPPLLSNIPIDSTGWARLIWSDEHKWLEPR